ncbi:MAG: hypothetical protein R2834_15885 [Rhodothermales bacterium]
MTRPSHTALRAGLALLIALTVAHCGQPEEPIRRSERRSETRPLEAMKQSDCFTCHGITEAAIGPAYVRIAQRYAGDGSVRAGLVNKVMEGGGGLWGGAQMSRHPFLKEPDVGRMVDWILSTHARDSLRQDAASRRAVSPVGDAGGVRLRLFPLEDPGRYPDLGRLDHMEPLFTGRLPAARLAGASLPEASARPLLAVLDGTLDIPEKNSYFFRLHGATSGRLIVDGEGVISPLEQDLETLLPLDAGAHRFAIQWPIRSIRDNMELEWIPPDSLYYGDVPAGVFRAH